MKAIQNILKSLKRTYRIYKIYKWKKNKEELAYNAWFNRGYEADNLILNYK